MSLRLDGLSLLFGLMVTGIGALILVYAGAYLKGDDRLGRLWMLLLLFMASMLGLVLADNLLMLFVFWELTSITSYLLIGFNSDRPESRASALQALLVTGGAPVSAAASWTVGWGGSTPQRPRRDGAGFSACASRARQRLRRVGRDEKVTRPVQFGGGVG